MWRKKRENELLALKFPHLSEEVREQISETQKLHKCPDTSDLVIDRLWNKCRSELRALLQEKCEAGVDLQPLRQPLLDESREIIRVYLDQALNYEAELMDQEDDAFEQTYREVLVPIDKAVKARRAQQALERDRWDFFNKPDADADYEQWRGKMLWPAQAVALSLGKDPDIVRPETLEPYRGVARSIFREDFKYRLELIEAAISAGSITVPISFEDFASWSGSNGLVLPDDFLAATNKISADEEYWKSQYEEIRKKLDALNRSVEALDPLSMNSIYRMILGMAVSRFEYSTNGRTEATKFICDALDELNLPLHKSTVLGHLRRAASELEFRQEKPIRWGGFRRPSS